MPRYLVYGVNTHTDFRREELESLATLHNISMKLRHHVQSSPFFTVDLPDDDTAVRLVARSILTRGIYELISHGTSYDDLHLRMRGAPEYPFSKYHNSSFRFTMDSFDNTRTKEQQREVMESFKHLGWVGRIEMKDPDHTFAILEEWRKGPKVGDTPALVHAYFARYVGGTSRHLAVKYDLKKRGYLGTTSMEAELSLVSANQVLADAGKIIYDPFVGTGSFLVSSSAFGATTLGSDIDGRQIKGKKSGPNIASNFEQYHLTHLLLDCVVFDVKHSPWSTHFKVDGILADPPYGVRAGAKTLGRAQGSRHYGRTEPGVGPDGVALHEREGYLPPKKPYELSDLADDLLDYASEILVDQARLVFWLPTVNEDYSPVDLPQRNDMLLVANSTQNFGRWSRRLLTYVKVPSHQVVGPSKRLERIRQPGHVDFREKYFARFGSGHKDVDGEHAFAKLASVEDQLQDGVKLDVLPLK